jgi:hypothetical protein
MKETSKTSTASSSQEKLATLQPSVTSTLLCPCSEFKIVPTKSANKKVSQSYDLHDQNSKGNHSLLASPPPSPLSKMIKMSQCNNKSTAMALHSSTAIASPPCLALLRSAMALDNMGVSLLERHRYTQAGTTFKEAVALLRSSGSNSSSNNKSTGCRTHAARLRLAQPQPDASTASTVLALPLLETISNSMTCLDLQSILPADDPSIAGPTVYAVRLEECHDDVELMSALLMHNFGLSYLLLARTMALRGEAQNASKYRYGAARLAPIAHSLVTKSNPEWSQAAATMKESVLLGLVVLQTLVHTVTYTQTAQAARPYASLLHQWRWTLSQSVARGLVLQQGEQVQSLAPAA